MVELDGLRVVVEVAHAREVAHLLPRLLVVAPLALRGQGHRLLIGPLEVLPHAWRGIGMGLRLGSGLELGLGLGVGLGFGLGLGLGLEVLPHAAAPRPRVVEHHDGAHAAQLELVQHLGRGEA